MTGLRALTLIRPMSAAIVHGTKRIENRPQDLPRAWRGRGAVVAVHAGKKWSDEYAQTCWRLDGKHTEWKDGEWGGGTSLPPPYVARVRDEGIVGLMRLTGRVYRDKWPHLPVRAREDGHYWLDYWWSGPFGYEIADAVAFPEPIACRGMQGFWPVPADVIATMRAQATAYGADALLEELFFEGVGEVKPCPECRSREGCEAECRVAPWNQR